MKYFKPIITFIAYFAIATLELVACYMFPAKDAMCFIGILALVTLIGFVATFFNVLDSPRYKQEYEQETERDII